MISVLVRNKYAWRKKEEEANESEKEENEQMSSISRLESLSSFACLLSIVSLPDFFSALSSQYFCNFTFQRNKEIPKLVLKDGFIHPLYCSRFPHCNCCSNSFKLKGKKEILCTSAENYEENKEFRLDSQ